MKTYLKGIKTVAVIFLSLALFSCQDEQIEPIDTLSGTTDGVLSERGKPPKDDDSGGKIYLLVSFDKGTVTGWDDLSNPNELESLDCEGTFNSVSTLLWFNDCDDLNIDGYNYGDISPYIGPEGSGEYLLRMSKNGDNYWFPFEGPAIDFSDLELGPIPIYKSGFLRPRTRERNLDTNRWEWNYDNESAGTYISIGIITIAAPL